MSFDPQGFDIERLSRIETWMDRYIDARKLPGASVLLSRGGKEVYFAARGARDVESGAAFQRDTIARIYSMTKPVTSVALMMLAEEGLFQLEAPLSEFLPDYADMQALIPGAERIDQVAPCATPTLRQMLTHSAGFSYPFNPGVLGAEMEERKIIFRNDRGTLADEVKAMSSLPLAFAPGTRWEYSVSIDLLGRVVEVVSGQPLDAFFAERILAPLGMTETAFSVPPGTLDRFASLYTPLAGDAMDLNAAQKGAETLRRVDVAGKSPFEATTCFSGGGGLVGTIDDYARFTEMLRAGGKAPGGRLLSPHTLAFMMRNHLPGDIASMGPSSFAEQPMVGTGFGLGGSIVLDPGRVGVPGSVGDFAWGGMASTFFWVDPVLDLTCVFFTQLSPSSSYPLRAELKALVHAALTE